MRATSMTDGTSSSGGTHGGGGHYGTNGGNGAVRIIWGTGRSFPATNTDLASSVKTWNTSTNSWTTGEITV